VTDKPSVAERIDALTTERRGISAPAFFGLTLVVALVVGFLAWSYREGLHNATAASKAQCQVSHLTRQAFIDLVNRDNAPMQIPDDATPQLRAYLEKRNADNEAYREKTLAPLRQLSCEEVGDVPAPSPRPIALPPAPAPVPPPIGLRGPEGPMGPAGKDGRDGADGRPGHDGKEGAPGAVVFVPEPSPSPEPTPSPIPSPEPTPNPPMNLPPPSPSPTPPVCILEVCLP
jgi:hypothetical protein